MQSIAEARGYELNYIDASLGVKSAELAHGCQVVSAFVNDTLSAPVLEVLREQHVELIAMRCAGFDKVDVRAANELGMKVVRVPAYSPHAVAEHAVGALLCLNRRFHKAYARVREGNFTLDGLVGFDLHGKTVGIVGTGKIGRCFASAVRGFGTELLAYDIRESAEAKAMGVRYCEIDELFEESDIISLHLPMNPDVAHFIDDDAFAKMKDGVLLVNVSRGGLISTDAALRALRSGKLGGLALDVYEREEGLFFRDFSTLGSFVETEGSPGLDDSLALLLSYPNVILTPHSAFLTREALGNIAETTFSNIDEYFALKIGGDGQLANEISA